MKRPSKSEEDTFCELAEKRAKLDYAGRPVEHDAATLEVIVGFEADAAMLIPITFLDEAGDAGGMVLKLTAEVDLPGDTGKYQYNKCLFEHNIRSTNTSFKERPGA